VSLGVWFATFRRNVLPPSSRVKQSKKNECYIFAACADKLCREKWFSVFYRLDVVGCRILDVRMKRNQHTSIP
jgi:hypothetical protein